MIVYIPIRTVSETNMREHWRACAKRRKGQRGLADWMIGMACRTGGVPGSVNTVRLTRIAPRTLDSDNLASAMKAIRDGVADALGVDDGDPGIEWRYVQRHGKCGEYAVEVEIE